jgi:hypothetical protein
MAESTSIALETESHGADTLRMLVGQRETSIDRTAFPFSQSTLQVDGHNFPPPDTPGSRAHHQNLPTGAFAPSLRRPGTPPLLTVQIDVYNHAYNYPLAKQLSSIAEQDYYSPISARVLPGSALVLVRELMVYSISGLGMGVGEKGWQQRVVRKGKEIGREGLPGHVLAELGLWGEGTRFDECEWIWVLSMKEGTSTNSNPSPSGPTCEFSLSVACPFIS